MRNLALTSFLRPRLEGFNPEQRRAIEGVDRATAVTAAAGSGKTSVLVERYLHLLAQGLDPSQILMLTFTTEAADQMRRRILDLLKKVGEECSELVRRTDQTPNIGTLHAFCYRLVDQYISHLERPRLQSIPSEMEQGALFELEFNLWKQKLSDEKINQLLDHYPFGEWRTIGKRLFRERHRFLENVSPVSDVWLNDVTTLFLPLLESLERNLRDRGWYQFDDLEFFALKLLSQFPEVTNQIADPIRAVMVDEFQDTSREQWTLIRSILKNRYSRLFFVGDPKQSIYRFRKAEVKIFEEATTLVDKTHGDCIELLTNYRTGPTLLNEVNRLCENLFPEKQRMVSGLTESVPASELEVIRVDGDRREIASQEREAILTLVKKLVAENTDPKNIALLFRSAERIKDLAEGLESQGIPTQFRRAAILFDDYEVIDLSTFVRVVANPLDDFQFVAFLRSRFGQIDNQTLLALSQQKREKKMSFLEAALENRPPGLDWFFSLIESGETSVGTLLEGLFSAYPLSLGLSARLFVSGLLSENILVTEASRRIDAWEKDEIRVASPPENAREGVRLMTVHSAKGLEFDNVLLVDLARGVPSHHPVFLFTAADWGARHLVNGEWAETETYGKLLQTEKTEEEKESKRVLYVALTRAKSRLFLFLPKSFAGIASASWAKLLESGLNPEN